MTFQPPPPPPGGTPPPPPPGQWGPPPTGGPGGGSSFDPKTVNPLDWATLGVGFLVLIFSFFSFYSASVSGPGVDTSVGFSAWHDIVGGGFFGWIAMVFAVAATVVLALLLFMPQMKFPFPSRLIVLAGYALAALCEILAIFLHPTFADSSETILGQHYSSSFGHGFSFWLSLILILGGTVLALMRFQQTGGQLPGPLAGMPNIGQHGPQGGIGGQQSAYGAPQGGYGAPQGGFGAPPTGPGVPPPPPAGYGPPQGGPGAPPPPPAGYGPPPQP
jgi:uncharacterized membrane protein